MEAQAHALPPQESAVNRLRELVATLLLVLLVGAGVLVAVTALMFGAAFGGTDGIGAGLRALSLDVAGGALLATAPAVLALVLRPSHPVASGTVAAFVGAAVLGIAGPHAAASGDATLLALGGFLLLVCAVPAPGRGAADRFGG